MDHLRTHLPFLQLMTTAKQSQCKALLKTISNSQLNILCEIAYNLTHGSLGIGQKEIKKLKPYKRIIRTLANEQFSSSKKRQYIINHLMKVLLMIKIALPYLRTITE